jgi:ASCH domain
MTMMSPVSSPPLMALSVRQPYAEQILTGHKRIEYRSWPTRKRERVWIYASKTLEAEHVTLVKMFQLPGGVIVGSVAITGCTYNARTGLYEWALADPERCAVLRRPERQPQPGFFTPFADV